MRTHAIKNNKGFTLMELLAVIVILAIIAGFVTLSVSGILDESKNDSTDILKEEIVNAAEKYFAENPCTSLSCTVTIDTLIRYEYLKSDILNPKNKNEKIDRSQIISVAIDTNGKATYTIGDLQFD